MEAAIKFETHEQVVTFDPQGNVVVNKASKMPAKVVARRAIEAHRERKHLEQDLDRYYDFIDL
ncbi:PA3496 family putative envelope integrity protein [Candidatus Thalassolituus haligoni]|uniref:PA3496 family putative envelope integrity protein n=1 Tax=Candidatus Thalassolituus haligoni TaxID=3100113 RepID=UPI003512AD0A|tara:strand:+ start:264 stop:452 length:189 start_codon:yes stop_codon:yes gene_type:complete